MKQRRNGFLMRSLISGFEICSIFDEKSVLLISSRDEINNVIRRSMSARSEPKSYAKGLNPNRIHKP